MIVTTEDLTKSVDKKIKKFQDIIYVLNFVNTEGQLGVVCYNYDNIWSPFCYTYEAKKYKVKAKNYQELLNSLPPLPRDSIADAKAKFYNTFDTPLEVNSNIFTTTFEVADKVLQRKTYYLITDVQELERTFNVMPCEIIDFDNIKTNESQTIDESLMNIINNLKS